MCGSRDDCRLAYSPCRRTGSVGRSGTAMRRRRFLLGLLALTLLAAMTTGASATPVLKTEVRNGDWIAYSTAPATEQRCCSPPLSGSDIYMVRPRGTPKLVASRGSGDIWNICPAFSPSGDLLAFGQRSPQGPSIRVIRISGDGAIGRQRIVRRTSTWRGAWAPCPKWSADGTRIAYIDRSAKHELVVMTLDGVRRPPRAGDPARRDFSRDATTLVSPDGALVARRAPAGGVGLVLSRRDGSDKFVVNERAAYGRWSYDTAGWSPDGRTLLVMVDPYGIRFQMVALKVTPSDSGLRVVSTPIVVSTELNHAKHQHVGTWPGYGDVSWQPRRA